MSLKIDEELLALGSKRGKQQINEKEVEDHREGALLKISLNSEAEHKYFCFFALTAPGRQGSEQPLVWQQGLKRNVIFDL